LEDALKNKEVPIEHTRQDEDFKAFADDEDFKALLEKYSAD
jgi:hypothetical protein